VNTKDDSVVKAIVEPNFDRSNFETKDEPIAVRAVLQLSLTPGQ
jgi:hypothetical protein